MNYKRICLNPKQNPACKKIIIYKSRHGYKNAKKKNNLCISCSRKKYFNNWVKLCKKCGQKRFYTRKEHYNNTPNFCRKCSEKMKLDNHPKYKNWIDKYKFNIIKLYNGKKSMRYIAKQFNVTHNIISSRLDQWGIEKRSNAEAIRNSMNIADIKKKIRLSAIKRIEKNKFNGGQLIPGYNPDACIVIDWFNMFYKFNFQHALNGGEICVGGFYPDGIDKEKMIIIEIDEKHHFNADGSYRQKDIDRQQYLEKLGYKFIRVRIK